MIDVSVLRTYNIEKCREEIESRRVLLSEMVGTLYQNMVHDELDQLRFRIGDIVQLGDQAKYATPIINGIPICGVLKI